MSEEEKKVIVEEKAFVLPEREQPRTKPEEKPKEQPPREAPKKED